MALSSLIAMIARLFGRAPIELDGTNGNGYQPKTLATPLPAPPAPATQPLPVSPSSAPSAAPTPSNDPPKVDIAPTSEPGWLDLCRPLTQLSEKCYLTAYPDPGSALAKALQTRGIWQKVLNGMPIPADEVLRKLSGAPWTCGWGQTGADVKEGTVWTQEQADERLEQTLALRGEDIDFRVKVPLAEHEKAALVDFAYNVGAGAFGTSTLLQLLNAGDRAGAAAQFAVWNKSAGVVLSGLVTRRARERDLFLTGTWSKS